MAESIRGNKTLSGTWGELWIDGEKIFEFSKIELKVSSWAMTSRKTGGRW